MKKNKILLYATSILSFIGTLILYPTLPARIPIHFNYQWEVDGYGSKSMALLLGVLPLAMCLLMDVLPKIDPKRRNNYMQDKVYDKLKYLLVFMMIFLNWFTLLLANGLDINPKIYTSLILGILLMALGNYLPKIKPNYFIGVKTPWTLANDVSWRKTHRISGYIFVLYGLLCLMSGVITGKYFGYALVGVMLLGIVVMFAYSYLVYRNEMKKKL